MDDGITNPEKTRHESRLIYFVVIALVIILGVGAWYIFIRGDKKDESQAPTSAETTQETTLPAPTIKNEEVLTGFSNIWDLVFPDSKTMMFSVRSGELRGASLDGKTQWSINKPKNIKAEGEGGLLGLALDKDFSTNKFAYMCYNATGTPLTVRVARFKLSDDFKAATDFTDIIKDIKSQGGRHSGCRLAMDKGGILWVGTGDSALGTNAQDPKSLAGKILRVDRDGKAAATGNQKDPYDTRIYSYGHRNVQGLVLFNNPAPNGALGYSAEHGSDKDDEINWLLPGNFGWNPDGANKTYSELAPMTDTEKYPNAVKAVWSSGDPTIAPSGMTILRSSKWKGWQGRIALAVLKDEHVLLLNISADGTVKGTDKILDSFGRIRAVAEGPDGNLYITTDNGGNGDKIIRVTPS